MEREKLQMILVFTASLVTLLAFHSADAIVPSIYVFGDSTVDVGNNNYLAANAQKANFPPNGIDFPGRVPTGRFCNGYIGIDYLAQMFGFIRSPPPFLSLTSFNMFEILRGSNFASGNSGILDTTGIEISMTQQIQYFSTVRSNLTACIGSTLTDILLSKSLFLISTGNNDLFADFAQFGPQNDSHKDAYVTILTSKYEDHLKKLYSLGARKFGIMGIGQPGCVPILRTLTPSGDCIEDLNIYGRKFNEAVKPLLSRLSSSLVGMKYSFGDSEKIVTNIQAQPSLYGLNELRNACCGGGRFNGESPCTPNATYCSNRNQYFFWDRFHPTQATYKIIAQAYFGGSLELASPINFSQLAF